MNALGRPPEEEDSAIAQEWSPRGGRRLRRVGRPRRRRAPVPPTDSDATDAAAREYRHQYVHDHKIDTSGQVTHSLSQTHLRPELSASPSHGADGDRLRLLKTSGLFRSPPRRRPRAGRTSWWSNSNSSASPSPSPSPGKNASLSYSPARQGRRKRRRGQAQGGGRGRGRADKGLSKSDDDGRSVGVSLAHPLDANTRWPVDLSPGPPTFFGTATADIATTKPLGNLGGPFMRPESPFRTYRAKPARLLRAQSSERAAAQTRRSRVQESLDQLWLSRSKSVDHAIGRARGRQHGSSGMTSPLLRREGFGLLQSTVTRKVFGFNR